MAKNWTPKSTTTCEAEKWFPAAGGKLQHLCELKTGHRGEHFCCEGARWKNRRRKPAAKPGKEN